MISRSIRSLNAPCTPIEHMTASVSFENSLNRRRWFFSSMRSGVGTSYSSRTAAKSRSSDGVSGNRFPAAPAETARRAHVCVAGLRHGTAGLLAASASLRATGPAADDARAADDGLQTGARAVVSMRAVHIVITPTALLCFLGKKTPMLTSCCLQHQGEVQTRRT